MRHSHGLYELAKLSSEIASLEHDIRFEEAKFRAANKEDYKTKWELDDAMWLDDDIEEMRKLLSMAEIRSHIVEGIVKGYDGLARAASREVSRRMAEQAPRD